MKYKLPQKKPALGATIQDENGRKGIVYAVVQDGIFVHPIDKQPIIFYHTGQQVSILTFWQTYGGGYSGKWYDNYNSSPLLKAYVYSE